MIDDTATVDVAKVASSVRKRWTSEGEKDGGNAAGMQRRATKVYCTSFDSRIGRIYVASTEKGVCKISVPKESRKDFFGWLKENFDPETVSDNRARNKDVIDQLSDRKSVV